MALPMKALRKTKEGPGWSLEEMLVPSASPIEVLVRVKAASICGTDLRVYEWDRWSAERIRPPVTLGHEFCGLVERVGREVTAVRPGDFVSAKMHINCGQCYQWRVGETLLCQKIECNRH